jgi:hypothetical protein
LDSVVSSPKSPALNRVGNDLLDVRFDDWGFAGINQLHFCPHRIYANDFMAFLRKASRANGTYIT